MIHTQTMDSSDEEIVTDNFLLGSSSESEFEEKDDLEMQSTLLDAKMSEDAQMAEDEHKDEMEEHEDLEINLKTEVDGIEDLNAVSKRLKNMLFVFSDFSQNRLKLDKELSRKDCLEIFTGDLATMYGYSRDVVEILLDIFGPIECHQFIEASEQSRPVTIRVNLLKTRVREVKQALSARGAVVEPIGEWAPHGLQVVKSSVPIGATPQYLGGHYMLQSASSFCPVLALDVTHENMKILDMSSAPGGKTTYIGMLMKNRGVLVANDISKSRQKATTANLHRMGVTNTVVVNYDGADLPQHFGGFDRILLDAPCTGFGVICRDPSIKVKKSMEDIEICTRMQKEMLLAAIDMLKVGGKIVYSTCSITIHENEDVVSYALKKRPGVVKLVETGLPEEFGVPGIKKWKAKQFPAEISMCRRFYPHVHNMDGFFVAKFEKVKEVAKDAPVIGATKSKRKNKKGNKRPMKKVKVVE